MNKRPLTVAILVLLLVQPAAALIIEDAAVSAQSAVVMGGATNGTLSALVADNFGDSAALHFSLTASIFNIEIDHSNLTLGAGVEYTHEPGTTKQNHGQGTLTGTENRAGSSLLVFPMGSVTVAAQSPDCARLAPADSDTQRPPLVSGSRPTDTASTGTSIAWDACGDAKITLQGDFVLRLWEWDAVLQSGGDTVQLHSGRDPIQPLDSPNAYESTEIYVFVQDGTLVVHSQPGDVSLFLQDVHATATGMRLTQASLSIADDNLSGVEVLLHGRLDAWLQRGGPGVQGTVAGTLDGATVDGSPWQPATISVVSPESSPGTAWLLLAPLLLLVTLWLRPWIVYLRVARGDSLDAWPYGLRQKRGAGYWVMANNALAHGRARLGHFYAMRACKLFPASMDARLAHAWALRLLGRNEESLTLCVDVHQAAKPGATRTEAACAAARAAAALGDAIHARQWLEEAAKDDASIARLILGGPEFQEYQTQPWAKNLMHPNSRPKPGDIAFA